VGVEEHAAFAGDLVQRRRFRRRQRDALTIASSTGAEPRDKTCKTAQASRPYRPLDVPSSEISGSGRARAGEPSSLIRSLDCAALAARVPSITMRALDAGPTREPSSSSGSFLVYHAARPA